MKRRLGTIVLFVLLILTVAAIQKIGAPTTTVSSSGQLTHITN